jgi:HEAT repeat protein
MAAFEAFRGLPMSTRAAHGGSIAAIALSDDPPHFMGCARLGCGRLFELLPDLPESVIREHETAIAALLHDTSADPRLRLSVFYVLDRFDSEKYIPDFITLLADPDDGNYDCNLIEEVFEILDAKEPAVLEKHSDALLAMVQYVSPAARGPRADAALQARGHRRRAGSGVRWCAKMLLAKFMPEFAEFA